MTDTNNFITSSADWRRQLRINDRRTHIVIVAFVAIYVCVGLVVDIYMHANLSQMPLTDALMALVTFQVIPTATLIMGGVAILSIFITYAFHDQIIMLGTEYHEVTPRTANSLEEQQLYNVVDELRIAASMPFMPRIFIIDADYMNAFASGYSEKSALVAITRGLMQKLNRSELQAVMAHELSHIRHHDIKLTLAATVLCNIMVIVIDILFRGMIFGGGRRSNSRDEKGSNGIVVIIVLLRFLLPILTVLLMLYLSRTREFMADAGAVELTRDNSPLAKALMKISGDYSTHQQLYAQELNQTAHEDIRQAAYIFDPTQAGISIKQSVSSLFSTHPSLEQRLAALGIKKIKN